MELNLKQNLLKILLDLIKINSVIGHEEELCKTIKKSLVKLNIPCETHVENNLVFTLNKTSSPNVVALCGHLDTVNFSDINQLTPKIIDDGYVSGLGSVDMKPGLAIMLKLASDFQCGLFNPKYTIKFIFYSGEEGPLPNGVNTLLKCNALKDIDFCFVLEPTCSKYCFGCLGAMTIHVRVKGKSAHSAYAWEGKNAIYHALPLIEKINSYQDRDLTIDSMSCRETLNLTKITTCNPHNAIPEECLLTINYRFSPIKSVEEATSDLKKIISRDFEIIDISPSCYTSNPCISLNEKVEKEIFQGWSDMAQLNIAGIQSINYGPGDLKLAHSPREKIPIAELEEFYKEMKFVLEKR